MVTRFAKFLSLVVIAVGIVLLLLWAFFRYTSTTLVEEELTELTTIHQRQLEMYVEITKLFITLGTLLFGAIGAMFAHFYGGGDKAIPQSQIRLALVAMALAGSSMLCGYLSYRRVIIMFQANFFNLSHPRVAWPSQLQFYLFLASTFIATWFGYRAALRKER